VKTGIQASQGFLNPGFPMKVSSVIPPEWRRDASDDFHFRCDPPGHGGSPGRRFEILFQHPVRAG